MDAKLPDKQYMKIGEVSRLTYLNSSVLRFWESEFTQLRPVKSRSGQRLYTRQDLELVLKIKELLYQEKLTIAGAKCRIDKECGFPSASGGKKETCHQPDPFEEVREELRALRDMLD